MEGKSYWIISAPQTKTSGSEADTFNTLVRATESSDLSKNFKAFFFISKISNSLMI
jgi:hypothetical protein